MTLTTTVMVMETTGALQLIVPIMLTVFVAKARRPGPGPGPGPDRNSVCYSRTSGKLNCCWCPDTALRGMLPYLRTKQLRHASVDAVLSLLSCPTLPARTWGCDVPNKRHHAALKA